jgi:hypothetical protein
VPVRKRKRGPEPGSKNAEVKWKKVQNGRVISAIATEESMAPCPSTMKTSAPQGNWSVEEWIERLRKAVTDWLASTGSAVADNGNRLSLMSYSMVVDVPYGNL